MLNNLSCTLQREYSCVAALGSVCAEQAGDRRVMTGVYTAETGESWTLYQAESFDLDSVNNNHRPPSLKQRLQSRYCVVNSHLSCGDVTGRFTSYTRTFYLSKTPKKKMDHGFH